MHAMATVPNAAFPNLPHTQPLCTLTVARSLGPCSMFNIRASCIIHGAGMLNMVPLPSSAPTHSSALCIGL